MYFYHKNGKKFGPVSIEKLEGVVRANVISLHDTVTLQGSSTTQFAWQVIKEHMPDSDVLQPEGKQDDGSGKAADQNEMSGVVSGGKFEISHSVTGAPIVRFDCPHCDLKLRAGVEEVGKEDSCPECGTKFVTPGPSLDVIKSLLKAVQQKRAAAKKTGIKAAKGFGTTTLVIAISVAAIATAYYLYLAGLWLTTVVSENYEMILGFLCLFFFIAVIIGLIILLAAASEGKSGVDNPIVMLFVVLLVLPTAWGQKTGT